VYAIGKDPKEGIVGTRRAFSTPSIVGTLAVRQMS